MAIQYRLVFGLANQEDLLEGLQRQLETFSTDEQERVLKRLASYMLNLSPIGHEEALRHAEEEADDLLVGPLERIEKLLRDVERLRAERTADVAPANIALEGLIAYVRGSLPSNTGRSNVLRSAVAALAFRV